MTNKKSPPYAGFFVVCGKFYTFALIKFRHLQIYIIIIPYAVLVNTL